MRLENVGRGMICAWIAIASACSAAPRRALTWSHAPELAEIAELEDARSDGHGRLMALARHTDSFVRRRALTALGRLLFPENGGPVTEALIAGLRDSDASVRAAAAFALGFHGDPAAGDALLALAVGGARDPDATVRARAVEALSKLERSDLRERSLAALGDPDPRVRVEAACGTYRWTKKEELYASIDKSLLDRLSSETDRQVELYALFALERRKTLAGVAIESKFAKSPDATLRLFAVRALAALANDGRRAMLAPAEQSQLTSTLTSALGDPDWRVAAEAVRGFNLAQAKPSSFVALTQHLSANVRRATWESLSAALARADDSTLQSCGWFDNASAPNPRIGAVIVDRLRTVAARAEYSAMVRGDALDARLHLYGKLAPLVDRLDDARTPTERQRAFDELLPREPYDTTPLTRAGAARGFAFAPASVALGSLLALANDPDHTVAEAALESLGSFPGKTAKETLLDFLHSNDNGLRLQAVTSLASMLDEHQLGDWEFSFDRAVGDISNEIKFNVLRNAAQLGTDRARTLLERALGDPSAYVRSEARRLLADWYARKRLDPPAFELSAPATAKARVPLAGRDFPEYEHDPIVEVLTQRGAMRFELFPAEAPVHVFNFLELARRGYYDGLSFHRVVPDFVIQGGDYRGDGNGGTTFRVESDVRAFYARGETVPADALRHEIGARKFVRGSLGMPRNDDFESGGSQFFVTHRETPHLDGRYTIFGELREGFDVLDRIEVGDQIVSVKLVDDGR